MKSRPEIRPLPRRAVHGRGVGSAPARSRAGRLAWLCDRPAPAGAGEFARSVPGATVEWGGVGRDRGGTNAPYPLSRPSAAATPVPRSASLHLAICAARRGSQAGKARRGSGGRAITGAPFVVTLLTALGCAIMAGALFAFSA